MTANIMFRNYYRSDLGIFGKNGRDWFFSPQFY